MTERVPLDEDNIIMEPGRGEIARLTLQQKILNKHMESLILAPLDLSKPGLRILDQATADGLWLRDVAAATNARHIYVGTDIVQSYFPKDPPPNFSFHIQSMNDPWPLDWKNSFDLVHSRFSLAGAGPRPIQEIVTAEVELVKPGGWIQIMELQLSDYSGCGPAMQKGYKLIGNVFDAIGVGHEFWKSLKQLLEDAGLEDIHHEVVTIQLGAGNNDPEMAKDGILSMSANVAALVQATKHFPPMSIPEEELITLVDDVKEELSRDGGEWRFPVAWGRKPPL